MIQGAGTQLDEGESSCTRGLHIQVLDRGKPQQLGLCHLHRLLNFHIWSKDPAKQQPLVKLSSLRRGTFSPSPYIHVHCSADKEVTTPLHWLVWPRVQQSVRLLLLLHCSPCKPIAPQPPTIDISDNQATCSLTCTRSCMQHICNLSPTPCVAFSKIIELMNDRKKIANICLENLLEDNYFNFNYS